MNQKDTLRPYIEAQLKAGTPPATVKQLLVEQGWGEPIVDEVINETTQAPQPTQPAQLHSQLEDIRRATFIENYGVIQAFKDAFGATKNNTLGIGIVAAIGLVMIVAGSIITTAIFTGILFAASALGSQDATLTQFIIASIVALPFVVATSALFWAFMQSLLGLAINDGADGKKSNIKATILSGAKRTIRVALANMLQILIVGAPLLVALLLGLVLSIAMPSIAWLTFILIIVGVILAIPLALRLALMPVIAVFENDLPLRNLYSRTKLLMQGGIGFMAKFWAVSIAIGLPLSILLPSESELVDMSVMESIPTYVKGGCVSLLLYSVLVMFYRNRRDVKDGSE